MVYKATFATGKTLENVYIHGNVASVSMTKGETLYNVCVPDTCWAHGDHDEYMTAAERKRRRPDVKLGARLY